MYCVFLSRHTLYKVGYYVYCGFVCFFLCTVTDVSAGALTIRVKLCMVVRPDLRQVFSHFGVDSATDGRAMGVNRGNMAGYASC